VIGWATAWDYIQPNPEIVAYLLAQGARHNIFSAVAMGEAEIIRELVARTLNDLERRMNGTRMRRMPLHLAVIKNQPASVTTLLDLGANTESLDEAGFSALDLAALDLARPGTSVAGARSEGAAAGRSGSASNCGGRKTAA
jgi:ankyrin repeat protein